MRCISFCFSLGNKKGLRLFILDLSWQCSKTLGTASEAAAVCQRTDSLLFHKLCVLCVHYELMGFIQLIKLMMRAKALLHHTAHAAHTTHTAHATHSSGSSSAIILLRGISDHALSGDH